MKAHLSKIIVDDGNSSSDNFSEKRYVYLNDIPRQPQQQVIYDNTVDKRNIIPSKVLVIDNFNASSPFATPTAYFVPQKSAKLLQNSSFCFPKRRKHKR